MKYSEKLIAISEVLKEKFTNLTVEETIKLATRILDRIGDES